MEVCRIFRATPSERRLSSLERNKPVVGSGDKQKQELSLNGATIHRPRDIFTGVSFIQSQEGTL